MRKTIRPVTRGPCPRLPALFLLPLCLLFLACGSAPSATGGAAVVDGAPSALGLATVEPVLSGAGMVTSDAPLATAVGARVLAEGGNAVDAAVATAFALAVVYPEAGNVGGGGFMVVHLADGTTASLDFRETAPAAARPDMYLDERGELTDRSVTGHLASGVPGSVAGLWAAHRRFGTRPWSDLLAPAIALADEGFVVDDRFAQSVAGEAERLARFEASARLFLPGGRPLRAGTHWRNPELAAVLRRVADDGPAGFYQGETARLIESEMRRGGGIIDRDDLAGYAAAWREPVRFRYRGHTVLSMPPPSSGGITLAMIANILQAYDLGSMGWHSPRAIHLTAEAMRRAFADRNHFLGDPDFIDIPRDRLLSDSYAAERRRSITEHATPSADVEPGTGTDGEGDHTTHFSIVDGQGNAVALTTTVNFLFGSAVTVAGAGFVMNDEMDDFAAKPGEPNAFGLVQGEANAIAPGKRMLSAMSPTIVLGPDGAPRLITGARGGPRIITGVFQVISNVLDHDMPIDEAVRSSRIHHQHLPDILYYEPGGLDAATVAALEARGHTVEERGGYIGNAPSILRRGPVWAGVPDPRTGGMAAAPERRD